MRKRSYLEHLPSSEPLGLANEHCFARRYILKDYKSRANVAGVGLLAAAPPQGNDAMVKRFFQKSWWHAAKLTW